MKDFLFLKLFGMALLAMTILVLVSFLEVVVYSYLINPGHEMPVYEAHAQFTAPYISGIFGFIVFFLVLRYWKKKGYEDLFKLAIYYPLTYILLDIVILTSASVDWSSFIGTFVLANGAKLLGSYLGYRFS